MCCVDHWNCHVHRQLASSFVVALYFLIDSNFAFTLRIVDWCVAQTPVKDLPNKLHNVSLASNHVASTITRHQTKESVNECKWDGKEGDVQTPIKQNQLPTHSTSCHHLLPGPIHLFSSNSAKAKTSPRLRKETKKDKKEANRRRELSPTWGSNPQP